MRSLAPLGLAALVAAASGCSLVAVRRPQPSGAAAPDECTQSRVAPGLDTAGAIVTPILGLATYGACIYADAMQSWSSSPQRLHCSPVLWGTVLTTAVYTGSAVYGFRATGECRRLHEERGGSPNPGAGDPARPTGGAGDGAPRTPEDVVRALQAALVARGADRLPAGR